MVFKTDIATYSVCLKGGDGALINTHYNSFAAAAGHAEALDGVVRMINVTFSNQAGDSSISGMLYMYSKDNTRRIGSKYLVKASTERKGL